MRKVLAAIMSALAAMGTFVTKKTWNAVRRTWEFTHEVVPAAVGGAITMAGDIAEGALVSAGNILSLPARILGLAGAGVTAGMPNEQQASAQASQRAVEQERRADDAADVRNEIGALRRIAVARSRGEDPLPDALAAVPDGMARHIMMLSPDEARLVSVARTADLRRWLSDENAAPKGVRSPAQLANDEAALSAADRRDAAAPAMDERGARRAAVRAALREGRGLRLSDEDSYVSARAA